MKFINLPADFAAGVQKLSQRLGTDNFNVTITVGQSNDLETGFKNGEGYINCSKKHHFFRLLALFVQHYNGEEFSINEKSSFETLSCMLDLSAGGLLTVKSICDFLEYMSIMGFNQLQMYMEDTYEIKSRPYFGYLRGRYTQEELKSIDDYAFDLGIEVVPCIQTLGHLAQYLRWPEAANVAENGSVLLPESEETYALIEEMITTASAPFRSKRIHVGLDETHGLGLGKYFKEHGYKDTIEIFVKHVQKVTEIAVKHGLKPMMWNDMFFCYSSPNYEKYSKDTVVPTEIVNAIPKEMQLVYWNYEYPDADDHMLEKLYAMEKTNTMFAGGIWIFAGILPDNIFSASLTEKQLRTCKQKGVKEVMLTVWAYSSTVYHTALLEMQRYAELTYNDNSDNVKERFEFCTGASYDAYMRMSDFQALYSSGKNYDDLPYTERFAGKQISLQDIMLGLLDDIIIKEPRSGHYKKGADYYRELVNEHGGGQWDFLYRLCLAVFEYMSAKCEVAEKLLLSYKNGDKDTLRYLLESVLPTLLEKTEDMSYYHMLHKEKFLKPFGAEKMAPQYGGLKERCKYAMRRLELYLSGEIDSLEELEQDRLPITIDPWCWSYYNLSII
ncbi:MAG: family 20 glycosylhydrolase [Clostridia bacterium]|nr:family 20 glycosylhydrolase [Clostridia bacterium]